MDVRESSISGVPLLKVTGDLDHSNADELGDKIHVFNDPRVLVDLTDCPYLDSGGLAVFLSTVRDVRGKGWVGIVGANANVRRLFEIIGLTADPDFRVFSDTDEAGSCIDGGAC
ncbi:MAG: STAS domain-containing protein [Actinobacteria bacterium]|nr:STAS domain-containing protein [Actinomycetota bacterium]